ncbi:hypothetical protein SAMN06298224_2588 [Fibrobacter sp. UWB16]|uniref:hypothetical protein n=1 Tax=unclassified Fibrobacter TaxID=2634177 RepID=UPI000B51EC6B|nr:MULTISPECIES: hypothetical protein [unclassified Fibrobacter]OWV20902.1 hypothetical protein B7991_06565 [Fibrobacter sp. UWB3]SOD16741.1 hypothetical protein SAMN06298224_2588 [Fibrobacter sp. UWB16]
MKLGLLFCAFMIMAGCALNHNVSQPQNTEPPKKYIEDAPRDRQLVLSGKVISESELGGVERWYAIDKYGGSSKVRFQVGYFRDEPNIGFVLYEGGTRGELAICYRAGLNLRWDWGNYSIVIKSDGTGLYYDFSSKTTDVPPRETFKVNKF